MGKTVYSVSSSGPVFASILKDAGFELITTDGTLDMDHFRTCDVLVPGKAVITREMLEEAQNLKLISKFGVGMDRIDLDACTELGIWACNTPLVNYVSVAEHTVALLLAACKQLYPISIALHNDHPAWAEAHQNRAIELNGKTISLIGFGHIGRYVARLLSGFEMNIIAYDPYVPEDKVPPYVVLTRDLDEALMKGDFVSIHVSGEKSTRHLIGERELSLMKPTAIFLNTTRGFVVDEQALIRALKEEKIAGAALDVFEKEPVIGINELLLMDNVIATPHNAANTPEASLRSQRDAAANILDYYEGKEPRFAVNKPTI